MVEGTRVRKVHPYMQKKGVCNEADFFIARIGGVSSCYVLWMHPLLFE